MKITKIFGNYDSACKCHIIGEFSQAANILSKRGNDFNSFYYATLLSSIDFRCVEQFNNYFGQAFKDACLKGLNAVCEEDVNKLLKLWKNEKERALFKIFIEFCHQFGDNYSAYCTSSVHHLPVLKINLVDKMPSLNILDCLSSFLDVERIKYVSNEKELILRGVFHLFAANIHISLKKISGFNSFTTDLLSLFKLVVTFIEEQAVKDANAPYYLFKCLLRTKSIVNNNQKNTIINIEKNLIALFDAELNLNEDTLNKLNIYYLYLMVKFDNAKLVVARDVDSILNGKLQLQTEEEIYQSIESIICSIENQSIESKMESEPSDMSVQSEENGNIERTPAISETDDLEEGELNDRIEAIDGQDLTIQLTKSQLISFLGMPIEYKEDEKPFWMRMTEQIRRHFE